MTLVEMFESNSSNVTGCEAEVLLAGVLVCGFTDFPLGCMGIPCFHGNMLFGLNLAAGKFFSLHFE